MSTDDERMHSKKKFYFIAICGTGMASLAAMLKHLGHEVSGSDEHVYPPMSTFLAEQNIPVFSGFDPRHLADKPDCVVIGNAMSRGNPEVEHVLNHKLPFTSMPAALWDYCIRGRDSCVVSGTHGKTTTAAMLAWVLQHAGQQPGMFVGGIPENFGHGFLIGDGPYFVVEGDEYDSAFFDKGAKFLHYFPDLLIINNIEYDHADIYKNLEEMKISFRRLINIVPGNGHIIANADDPVVMELVQRAYSHVHKFSLEAASEWQAANLATGENGTSFEIRYRGRAIIEVQMALFGRHNVANALAVFVAATQLGLAPEAIASGLQTFKGVRRRLTRVAEIDGVQIYDDFAHHATAVKATLEGLRARFPEQRIWALFEPRSASAKRKVFQQAFAEAFDAADVAVVAPLHRADKVPEAERLSIETLVADLRGRGLEAHSLKPGDEMLEFTMHHAKPGDIFVFMSNGDFEKMPGKLAEALNDQKNK